MNRRQFLALGGIGAATSMMNPIWASDMFDVGKHLDYIGVQLYTVRDDMKANPVSTLRKIASIGYKHVESAGYSKSKFYGMGAKQYRSLLDDIGLKQHSGHCSIGYGEDVDNTNMVNRWESVCEDAYLAGQEYIVLGWIGAEYRKTLDDYKKVIDLMNTCGEVAKKYNLQFCFHNHDFEFKAIDGKVPYDLMLSLTDKENVKFELDNYWTTAAKVSSEKLVKANPGRFPLFHVKDMAKKEVKFIEVGNGRINYPKILRLMPKAGTKYFYVEQDTTYDGITPLDSIERSFTYLNSVKI